MLARPALPSMPSRISLGLEVAVAISLGLAVALAISLGLAELGDFKTWRRTLSRRAGSLAM